MVLTAFWAYDYLLTLPDEFRLIWKKRVTGPAIIFMLTRYLAWLSIILGQFSFTCQKTVSVHVHVGHFTRLNVAVEVKLHEVLHSVRSYLNQGTGIWLE